jgi:transposase-like protein
MDNVIVIKHKPHCTIHNKEGTYNEKFDSYHCSDCNRWLEKNCGDIECFFCQNRPGKPNDC